MGIIAAIAAMAMAGATGAASAAGTANGAANEAAGTRFRRALMLDDSKYVHPSFRTWTVQVDEPGLYALEIKYNKPSSVPRYNYIFLDGVEIGDMDFSMRRNFGYGVALGLKEGPDGEKRATLVDADGMYRRARWLEKGEHTFDIAISAGSPWVWEEHVKDFIGKGERIWLARLEGSDIGFWLSGDKPDCLVRATGETLAVAGCAATGAGRRRCRMEVALESRPFKEATVWRQELDIGAKPVEFRHVCGGEGTYRYRVVDAATGEALEGPWSFVVVDVASGAKKRAFAEPVVVDSVDCAAEGKGGPHLFRDNGTSTIAEENGVKFRLVGPKYATKPVVRKNAEGKPVRGIPRDWYAYTLKVAHPGKPHAVRVTVPNGERRLTHVLALDRRTRSYQGNGIDAGDAPASGPTGTLTFPVYPNGNEIDLVVKNSSGEHFAYSGSRRAGTARLELLEFPDGFPQASGLEPRADRLSGWCGEQGDLGPHERTWPEPGHSNGWKRVLQAWDRAYDIDGYYGNNFIGFPIYSYGMQFFGGPAMCHIPVGSDYMQKYKPAYDDPVFRDVFALQLLEAEKHGIRIYGDLFLQRFDPGIVAEAYFNAAGMPRDDKAMFLSLKADGKPFVSGSACHYLLNPAHPAVRRQMVAFAEALGRRYGGYKAFAGLRNRIWPHWPGGFDPWFVNYDLGYDDFTVGEFSKWSGIDLPKVGDDEKAFNERRNRLKGDYAETWKAWRTHVCETLMEEMIAALRRHAPGATIYKSRSPAIYAPGTGIDAKKFASRGDLGFSSRQCLVGGPGIECNGWDIWGDFSNFFDAVPELATNKFNFGGNMNGSMRIHPYQLEKPAKMLAEDDGLERIMIGGFGSGLWMLEPLDPGLRDFIRAWRKIPPAKGWKVVDRRSPVVVRWRAEGDDVVFWGVNVTDAERRLEVKFASRPKKIEDLAFGGAVRGAGGSSREVALAPFMPGIWRAKGAKSLVSATVPVPEKESSALKARLEAVRSLRGNVEAEEAASGMKVVERRRGGGENYIGDRSSASALGERDGEFTYDGLVGPMEAALAAGDYVELRRLLDDFEGTHRWWFEAFGWPDDLCVRRNVHPGRGSLPYRFEKKEDFSTNEATRKTAERRKIDGVKEYNGADAEFLYAPQGFPAELGKHMGFGGWVQVEVCAMLGGGYGDIRVETRGGKTLGTIKGGAKERFETRVLWRRIHNVGFPEPTVRLVGTGPKGLWVNRFDLKRLPPEPVTGFEVVGAFDKGGNNADKKECRDRKFPPEPGLDGYRPDATYEGFGGRETKWRHVELGPGERVLDLYKATDVSKGLFNTTAYLRTVVKSDKNQSICLYWTADWYGTIWLNGVEVKSFAGTPGKYSVIDKFPDGKYLSLKKGENEIIVKTMPGGGGWHFGLAIDMQ